MKEVDWEDRRKYNRVGKSYATEEERIIGNREKRIMRSRRYRARMRLRLHPECQHNCGCDNQIEKPFCGMCAIGLCGKD